MASERARSRCRERLEKLSRSQLDRDAMRREAIADLRATIGFDRWCWPLADPETLLPAGGLAEHDYGPRVPRTLELEYSQDHFAAKHVLARRVNPAGSLNVETGGDLARSARWDEVLRTYGIGDVAVVACRDDAGCWGWIEVYRDGSDRDFDAHDLELLASVGASLGSGLRRNVLSAHAVAPETRPSAVLVLDRALRLLSWTESARAWLDVLPSAALNATWGILPTVIYPAVTVARTRTRATAYALLHGVDGSWVMIDAAPLEGNGEAELAVTLRSPTPAETFRLFGRAYALSSRERDVVSLLTAGLDTRTVAERLHISPLTVQDHLKSVFEKTGIHSRRELLATLGSPALN
jgi:DNA-binding CsgD family transcriptional regulator